MHLDWFDAGCLLVAIIAALEAAEARTEMRRLEYLRQRAQLAERLDVIGSEVPYYGPVTITDAARWSANPVALYDQDADA